MCYGQRLYYWPPMAKKIATLRKNLNVSDLLCVDGGSDFSKNDLKDYKMKNAVAARSLFPPEALHKIVALATCPPRGGRLIVRLIVGLSVI